MNCRIVHLVTDPKNDPKEKQSVHNLKTFCSKYPVEYKQCINEIYKSLPPRENCNRPDSVNMEPGNGNLSPGHYGCFLAHKNGISLEDNINYDFVLIFEDAVINHDFDDFYNKLKHYYDITIKEDLEYFNLANNQGQGYTYDMDRGDYVLGVHFFIPAQSYMIPREKLKSVQFKFKICPWDAYDLWITKVARMKTGCSKQIYTKHCSGYSHVDKCIKNF